MDSDNMEPKYKIRAALPGDLEIIYDFICQLEDTIFDFPDFAERFKTNLLNNEVVYLVSADKNGIPMGFIGCRGTSVLHHEGLVFEIQEMYVAKNWRNQGIGQALFAALEKKLLETKVESLEVTTNVKRIEAQKFYEKLGFQQTHVKFVKQIPSKLT